MAPTNQDPNMAARKAKSDALKGIKPIAQMNPAAKRKCGEGTPDWVTGQRKRQRHVSDGDLKPTTTQACRLFAALPPEVRLEIFKAAFVKTGVLRIDINSKGIRRQKDKRPPPQHGPVGAVTEENAAGLWAFLALTLTCKQARQESRTVFFENTKFFIPVGLRDKFYPRVLPIIPLLSDLQHVTLLLSYPLDSKKPDDQFDLNLPVKTIAALVEALNADGPLKSVQIEFDILEASETVDDFVESLVTLQVIPPNSGENVTVFKTYHYPRSPHGVPTGPSDAAMERLRKALAKSRKGKVRGE